MKALNLGKRVLAALLVCTMLLTMISATVLAEEGEDTNTDIVDPDEVIDLSGAISVTSAEELAQALTDGINAIRVTSDFELDRTFFITADTYIFSEEAVTLTRSATFGGDIFVVGEAADGTACETAVTLTLGHPESTAAGLLTIDGNKDNMTVDVTGTVIYVVTGSCADLYSNLTVKNAYKNGNEKTITAGYGVSYPPRVGGAVAILTNKSSMNIYGGTYADNRTNDAAEGDSDDVVLYSAQGGAFYNFGTLNIYGGSFTGNHAARGGFLFNYRTARIYNATISGNSSSGLGGAIYVPNSTAARLYLGGENSIVDSNVIFENNTANSHGGAIYARTVLEAERTTFRNNHSTAGAGGAIAAYSMVMTFDTSTFEGNTASTYGGAVYYSGENGIEDTPELSVTGSAFIGNSAKTGGAVYLTGGPRGHFADTQFVENTATDGGAVYLKGSHIDANEAEFFGNSVTNTGGAIALYESSTAKMNALNADDNSAKAGGFLYAKASEVNLYNSLICNNTSTSNGAGMALYDGAFGGIYATTFDGNASSGGNGGAIFFYTNTGEFTVHSSVFANNEGVSGGALYASNKSVVHMYNNQATDNRADKGGFLYQTTTGTTINLIGITLSGNTATTGGPIIWGNSTGAKLYIDKGKYYDLDYTGDWDDAYWAAAIYNSLKVYETTKSIPTYIDYDGTEVTPKVPEIPSDVTTSAQLERAIEAGKSLIRVTADFELDRTFYISHDVTLYSLEAHTLTRAADFAGDIFVVGETADGDLCKETVTLSLGAKESTTQNLLIIDGNKDNMTVDVTGSVIFVTPKAQADLYENLTVRNAAKVGNVRTKKSKYGVSYPPRVGGAVAILSSNSSMNVYGGIYENNTTNDAVDSDDDDVALCSAQGGAIYNYGTLNIYGGVFKGNHAARGGFLFNYRTARIYRAQIIGNSASQLGGAVYMPNSTGAFMYVGEDNELVAGEVLFSGNTSVSHGGAIYARNALSVENTTFENNATDGYGGAIVAYTTKMSFDNCVFEGNTATKYGGALYSSGNDGTEDFHLTISNTSFTKNTSSSNGGALYLTADTRASILYSSFAENKANSAGGAIYVTGSLLDANVVTFTANTAKTSGGAICQNTSSQAMLNRITATGNGGKQGGFLYATAAATTNLYNSTITENTSTGDGGAMYLYTDVSGGIYSTTFSKNTAGTNGGALFLYTNTAPMILHTCTFAENEGVLGGVIYASGKARAYMYNTVATDNVSSKGGFLYETVTGTIVDLIGVTVSGNTASVGGPIIWGNSAGAVLNIDKSKYTDEDHTGAYNSAYWSAAIYNSLKVKEITGEIPKYLDYHEEAYESMASATDVSNAEQLEAAVNSGAEYIRIIADFELDRTICIAGKTTIFSTLPRTITRAANFGGDMFVVGETADGSNALMLQGNATLVMGNPLSVQNNLLTIDGNKDNMTVPVVGTVFFVANAGIVDLHPNLSVVNCHKNDNERTYDERYRAPLRNRIGGAMAIVLSGNLNIYGGYYANNSINEEDSSSEETRLSTIGGLIFNYNNVRIYDGTFENNEGARGAVVYNYLMLKVYGGRFLNNRATQSGGVFYSPNTAPSHLHIGTSIDNGTPVVFQGNTAVNYGGVIYASALNATVIHGNTSFIENKAEQKQGGAISSYGLLTARDVLFRGNVAKNHGGAMYIANSSSTYLTRLHTFENCTFEENQATLGGALSLYASSSDLENGGKAVLTNCTFTANSAASPTSATTASYGGAIYMERQSELTMTDTTFTQNIARTEGGALYAAGESVITANGCAFTENTVEKAGKHGGAVSLHSAHLTADDVEFVGNTAKNNGGALYVSYSSNRDTNSTVALTNSSFTDNLTEGYGAAIYATRHEVTTEKRILDIRDTSFTRNVSTAGAVYLLVDVSAYMKNVTFVENSSTEEAGAAISVLGSSVEIDSAEFTDNASAGSGGAVVMTKAATVTLNDVTAGGNTSAKSGGFLYSGASTLKLYNSTIEGNTAVSNGGGLALYDDASSSIYATVLDNNTAQEGNGGGVFAYTAGANTLMHSCTLSNNTAAFGGGIYASNASIMKLYNLTATNNTAEKGGFLYETTTGTTIDLAKVTVSGNTATVGGPIIWGNSAGAVLNLDKSKYTDTDHTGALNDSYWAAAIVNKLTVNSTTLSVPTYKDYVSKSDGSVTPSPAVPPVSVQEIFDLAQHSSDADINSTYNKFPRLDNSSNFMSKNVTTFDNINGGTVTVDTFVYPTNGKADNCMVGAGLLIYQAMLYKRAHPDEDVNISISAYRFSTQSAVNINRNSRYFGYMRQLKGVDYDEYGFVRLSYLLVSAAKMGIHITAIGQLDGYPLTSGEDMITYFSSKASLACDPAYVQDGVVGDYLNFRFCEWPLDDKGGTDMMHTKLCAVSHYIDMNGAEHQNAIWTSSSNLDGINSSGTNANWKMQTGTIISGHEDLYRISVNYLRLVEQYSRYQNGVYDFQHLINAMNTEQARLISEGRGDEIAPDEQIVYLGSDTDEVFELYFTPLGGGTLMWDELNSPYCKYLRKLYDSEDYILFSWNAAEYSGGFTLGQQMEQMIIDSFHHNKNPKNKIYANMESFDPTTFSDLKVGRDIGYISINKWERGSVHNKDLMFSYVEDGQRYFVTLHNSTNMHSGSMCYQSNFALVIKEKTCSPDSVFSTFAKYTMTEDFVEHAFGDEQTHLPDSPNEDGYTYHVCTLCGETVKTGVIHQGGEWVVDREATATLNGIRHKNCSVCGELIRTEEIVFSEEQELDRSDITGKTFTAEQDSLVALSIDQVPHTFEALLHMPTSVYDRGGVIVGNYAAASGAQVNVEIYTQGKPRLFFVTEDGQKVDHVFNADIRSETPVHMAITVDGTLATLYVDGVAVETATLPRELPSVGTDFKVGGDNRTQYMPPFKGTIYSVSLFSDARTAEEIGRDMLMVMDEGDATLLYNGFFTAEKENTVSTTTRPYGKHFSADSEEIVPGPLETAPRTIEATVILPKDHVGDAGVIVGNRGAEGSQLNLEIVDQGRVKLVFVNATGYVTEHIFSADIRSDAPTHLAVAIDSYRAMLYVNGELVETLLLKGLLPAALADFRIGGDNCEGDTQYFKGTIYSVNLFGDVRTAAEIKADSILVPHNTPSLLYSGYYATEQTFTKVQTFAEDTSTQIDPNVDEMPHTFEATICLPKHIQDRGGVIVGNYGSDCDGQLNFEIYANGCPRLYYREGYMAYAYLFRTDIRSDDPTHIAVTIDGVTATLYVDGRAVETITLEQPIPAHGGDFRIGGDHRVGNAQYFKGVIYSVSLFADVRTADEIAQDMQSVSEDAESLLYTGTFAKKEDVTVGGAGTGRIFKESSAYVIKDALDGTLHTIEATVQLSPTWYERGGVIVSNYTGWTEDQLSFEIYTNGTPRLWYKVDGVAYSYLFTTDIRSVAPTHVALTFDGLSASLYVNGVLRETLALTVPVPDVRNRFCVGGDNRTGNTQYFKGTIYSVNLFGDVRTDEEIRSDRILVTDDADALLFSESFTAVENQLPIDLKDGTTFDSETLHTIDGALSATPYTMEAVLCLPKTLSGRGGVIFGNYDNSTSSQLNLEVYENGRLRLFYTSDGERISHLFSTDIRSDAPIHLAVTVDGRLATLYINGIALETAILPKPLPTVVDNFVIGGDHREGNTQYFKGTIYSVNLYGEVRTAEQICEDAYATSPDTAALLYSRCFAAAVCDVNAGEHTESDWIVDFEATSTRTGIRHTECTACGKILTVREIAKVGNSYMDYSGHAGMKPSTEELFKLDNALATDARTYEMSFVLPTSTPDALRGGVLFSNYDGGAGDQISIEIYTNGQARFWYKKGGVSSYALFAADVRSDSLTHLAFTVDGSDISLYINGVYSETITMQLALPSVTDNFCIGGDYRYENAQYFKGTIYSVNVFGDVRTAEEIAMDTLLVSSDEDDLLYSKYFSN